MRRFVKIHEDPNLLRDKETGANLSVDRSGYQARLLAKRKTESLEERVKRLEEIVERLMNDTS